MMSEDDILKIAHKISTFMKDRDQDAEIHFIGGEPTMLGLPFFESALPKFRDILKASGTDHSLILVTNMLSHDIVPICKLFDKVSTSYEPETRFPKVKLQEWFERSVREVKASGVDVGATVAVTKPVINYGGVEIIKYLESLGITQMHFGFFIPEGDGLVNIDSVFPRFEETSDFMIEVSDFYLSNRSGNMFINPIESMITSLHTEKPQDDVVCPIISGSIDINWDGNCNSCLEAGGSVNPQYSGNVFEKEIITITEDINFMKERAAALRPKKPCLTCEYEKICKGACSVLFKFTDDNSGDCHGFKKWINHLAVKINEGKAPLRDETSSVRGC